MLKQLTRDWTVFRNYSRMRSSFLVFKQVAVYFVIRSIMFLCKIVFLTHEGMRCDLICLKSIFVSDLLGDT